jgi:hypothetical protein
LKKRFPSKCFGNGGEPACCTSLQFTHSFQGRESGDLLAKNGGFGNAAGPKSEVGTTRPRERIPGFWEAVDAVRFRSVLRLGQQSKLDFLMKCPVD